MQRVPGTGDESMVDQKSMTLNYSLDENFVEEQEEDCPVANDIDCCVTLSARITQREANITSVRLANTPCESENIAMANLSQVPPKISSAERIALLTKH
jgi:hypothetical protein